MNRSPLFYPMNRGMDSDAGGAAELQTDVMRFMAIISLCLVAIFALVQSIPLAPQSPVSIVEEQLKPLLSPEPEIGIAEATEPAELKVTLTRPQPVVLPRTETPVALQRPARKVMQPPETPKSAAETPATQQATAATPRRKGFTLRFESDAVLTRLVENETVGLYVISGNSARRLQVESGNISYWPASTPDQFHEMDPATVPAALVTTWERQHGGAGASAKWGVSLPPTMSRQVRNHLAGSDGGALIIGGSGQVRLEP